MISVKELALIFGIVLFSGSALACPYDYGIYPHYVRVIANSTCSLNLTVTPINDAHPFPAGFFTSLGLDQSIQLDSGNSTFATFQNETVLTLYQFREYQFRFVNESCGINEMYYIYPSETGYIFPMNRSGK